MSPDELIAAFAADIPTVHRPGYGKVADESQWAPGGTYVAERECYTLMAGLVGPGSVTVETGLGLSTLLFASRGCDHTALFLDRLEEDALRGWADRHDVSLERVCFAAGPSDEGLRALSGPVDLFLIDGGHGYPLPQLDWFYGAGRVKRGGVIVLDDLQLWAPRQLDTFIGLDPRWECLARESKWSAYRRLNDGPVAEDYDAQPFLPSRKQRGRPWIVGRPTWKGRVYRSLPSSLRDRLTS